MGDLWPPSVLVAGDKLRIIDWEFAHFGFPFQDSAHLFAHLYMLEVVQTDEAIRFDIRLFRRLFYENYHRETASFFTGQQADWLFPVHVGGEILMRLLGPFQKGYLFEKMDPAHPLLQQLIEGASRAILDEELETFF